MDNDEEFISILDGDHSDLLKLSFEIEGKNRNSLYLESKMAYLNGKTEHLKQILKCIENHPDLEDYNILVSLTFLRLEILECRKADQLIIKLENLVENNNLWAGEVYAVLGYYQTQNDNYVKAKILFKKSLKAFKKIKAEKAALFALQNIVIAESNLYDGKDLCSEYNYIISCARKAKNLDVLTSSLLALSNHLIRSGVYTVALEKVDEALEIVEEGEGAFTYYLLLAQKAYILLQLNYKNQALTLIEQLNRSNFEEMFEIQKVLLNIYQGKDFNNISIKNLTQSWREKVSRKNKVPKLGKVQEKFLGILLEGPKSKNDIIDLLYPEGGEYFSLENRFKNLIGKLRKKFPDLIVYKDGLYQLSDTELLKEIKDAS